MRLVQHLVLAAAFIAAAASSFAQPAPATPPKFDVISVKPDKTQGGMRSMLMTPDGFSAENVTVHMLLLESSHLNEDQIIGEPAWANAENFDIMAKVNGADVPALTKLSFDERRAMFKQILTERFGLATHTETRQLPLYLLTVQKGGPKFKESAPDPKDNGQGRFTVQDGKIVTQGTTIAYFLSFLSRQVGRTIVDKTNLAGKYDITLKWAPNPGAPSAVPSPTSGPPPLAAPTDNDASIFTAIQEQLGLKLESAKGPVPVVVIDHVETPSEN
jgi:uncharacterized protein (TIGR03435 family)